MPPDGEALRAIRAWVRLDRAFERLNAELRRSYRVTGAQLAILRIVGERDGVTLRDLRAQLVMHPATLGQLVDRAVRAGYLQRRPSPADARARLLTVSAKGRRLLARAPIAGPVRLRHAPVDRERAARLAEALEDAVRLFGMEEWSDD